MKLYGKLTAISLKSGCPSWWNGSKTNCRKNNCLCSMPHKRHVRRHSVLKYGFAGYPPKPRASGYCLLYSLELRSRPLLSPKRTEPTATRLFLVEDRHCWSDIIRKLSYCAMPLFYLRKMAWSIKILFRNGMIQLLSQFPIKMLTRFTVSLMNTTNYGISRCATGTI